MLKVLILGLFFFSACTEHTTSDADLEHGDDYVLIEFASKLEEDAEPFENIQDRPLPQKIDSKK
jgi:hypothetical protein